MRKFSEYPYYLFMCKNKNVHAFFALHCNVLKNVGLCCQEKVFYNRRIREAPVPIVTGFQSDWSTGLLNRPPPILTGQLIGRTGCRSTGLKMG